ncbi:hypothetical protein XA68_15948 [Ophiocordyceps unilateralis]|uniref:Small ribosomal subunit protein eS4 N-terminal domain-containing protein n=1 Tax=Ophiocordyceps unilateralis TaxID=268505 RepID=A0A2A9P7G1_OPHUN|nr:hypothetical protein XA68_15948 [Ophiocordyceps unilateralis]
MLRVAATPYPLLLVSVDRALYSVVTQQPPVWRWEFGKGGNTAGARAMLEKYMLFGRGGCCQWTNGPTCIQANLPCPFELGTEALKLGKILWLAASTSFSGRSKAQPHHHPSSLQPAVIMGRGPKKHQKRLSAPSHWLLDKLSGTYAPKPSAGPHKLRDCMPLIVFIRNRLKSTARCGPT